MTEHPSEPWQWRERRQRELDYIDTRLQFDLFRGGYNGNIPAACRQRRREAEDPRWMPHRPPRKMTAAHLVARYWVGRGVFDVDVDHPACFRCQRECDEWRELERAHLVDRSADGLDHAGNLAMLCDLCHKRMPSFENGEEADALSWALRRSPAFARIYLARFGQLERQ